MSPKSAGGGGGLLLSLLNADQDQTASLVQARLKGGSAALFAFTTLFEDVARAQQACALALRDAAHKSHQTLKSGRTTSPSDSEGSTINALWAEANEFVMQTAKLQDQLATAISSKIVAPMQQTAASYESTRSVVCGSDTSARKPEPTAGAKAQRRAQAKLHLASEEVRTAVLNKDELTTRFGNDLKPELLKKANERVKRATALKEQADQELRDAKTVESSPDAVPRPVQSKRPATLTPEVLSLVENAETTRTITCRDAVKNFTRVNFTAVASSGRLFVGLSRAVEAYSPSFDLHSWVVKSAGPRANVAFPSVRDNVAALTDQEVQWINQEQKGDASATANSLEQSAALQSMKNILKTKDQKVKTLMEEVSLLKEELSVLHQQDFQKGGLEKGGDSKELSVPIPADQPPRRVSLPAIDPLPSSGRAHVRKASGSPDKSSPEKQNLFKRMATAIKGGKGNANNLSIELGAATFVSDSEDAPENSQRTQDAREYNPNDEDDASEEFKLTEYIPPLLERLNVTFPAGTKTSDKFLEIERRFEEYLWALRNLQLADIVRIDCWDNEGYCRGLDTEYGYQAYVHRLPQNYSLSTYTHVPILRALEWGSSDINSDEWKLLSYETLLLVYFTMSQALIARETARLPRQDIHELNVNDLPSHTAAKNPNKIAEGGGRHRRYSLVNPMDDRNTVNVAEAEMDPSSSRKSEDPMQTQAAAMLETNATLVRSLIRQWRLKIGLSAKDNSVITALLLPFGLESGEEGAALGFAALDVRYRVSRLHSSWVLAGKDINSTTNARSVLKEPTARSWVTRQLHFVRANLLMKIARLIKFLPQLKGLHSWLSEWPIRSDWHVYVAKRLPAPLREDDQFLRGHLHQLVDCLKLAMVILSDFCTAHEVDQWGVDSYQDEPREIALTPYDPSNNNNESPPTVPVRDRSPILREDGRRSTEMTRLGSTLVLGDINDERKRPDVGFGYRNAEGFLRLVALMTCIAGIDKSIRHIIAEDEKALAMGGQFRRVVSAGGGNDYDSSADESDYEELDNNPQDATRTLYTDDEWTKHYVFDLFAVLNANAVDVYWQYELPMQHLIISELICLVADDSTPNKLAVDGVSRMHATMIASHFIQHGFDPTVCPGTMRVPFVTLNLETYALYIIKALWEQTMATSLKKGGVKDEFDINLDEPSEEQDDVNQNVQSCYVPPNLMITREVMSIMNQIAADYVSWLITNSTPSNQKNQQDPNTEHSAGNGVSETSYGGTRVVTSAGADSRPAAGTTEATLSETRMVRLLNVTPHNMFDSLGRARGEYRHNRSKKDSEKSEPALGTDKRYTDATDPDFAVLDYDKLDEIADLPNFFQQIECIREEPEGVSLLLPSRLERVMSELSLRRMVTDPFRNQLFQALCDYRNHFESETLPSAIQLWDRVSDLLVLTPAKVPPQAPDMNQLNVLAPLPTVLVGPIAQFDLYRHFIVQTIRATFDRLFEPALSTIHQPTEEEAWFLSRLLDFDDEPEDEKVNIEKAWSKVVKKFADASSQFLIELRAELIYYTSAWTHFLPGNQHALIAMHTAEDRLRMMLNDLRNSPFWPEEDLPPNSAPIVAALAHFDNLVREVRIGTRYELLLAETEPLATPLAPCVATALNRKLQSMEGLLERCMRAEQWKPVDPPESLYSVSTVDLFQFIHHVLGVVWEFHTSPDWILPILIQFICRVARQFADFTKQSVLDVKLVKLSKRCDELFQHLLSPLPRVDVSLLGQLIGGGKDRKKKGWKGLVGLGGRKSRGKDLAHQLAALQKQAAEGATASSPTDEFGIRSPLGSGDDGAPFSGEEGSGDESESGMSDDDAPSQVGHRPRKKKKWKAKLPGGSKATGDEEEAAEITEELKELAGRIGPVMAVQLMNVSTSLSKTPLPTWLTRLHNLHYFTGQLPTVAQKIIAVAVEQATADDPKHAEILKALERAGGRKATTDKHGNNLDDLSRSKIVAWGSQLQEAVDQCKITVHGRATEICRLTALRIAYYDFCCDIFEELYQPDFQSGQTLTGVVASLNQTVLKFTQAAPAEYQQDLLNAIIQELGKAWAVVLTELGYAGHIFSAEDLSVMDSDLDALRAFASMHSVSEEVSLSGAGNDRGGAGGGLFAKFKRDEPDRGKGDDTPVGVQRINLFDYLSEFLVFLGTQPLLLAQLGGNYNPDKKKTVPQGTPGLANVGGDGSPKNDVSNVFADLGNATPAFEAKDILGGKKKKKGVLGGVWKAVGLK